MCQSRIPISYVWQSHQVELSRSETHTICQPPFRRIPKESEAFSMHTFPTCRQYVAQLARKRRSGREEQQCRGFIGDSLSPLNTYGHNRHRRYPRTKISLNPSLAIQDSWRFLFYRCCLSYVCRLIERVRRRSDGARGIAPHRLFRMRNSTDFRESCRRIRRHVVRSKSPGATGRERVMLFTLRWCISELRSTWG